MDTSDFVIHEKGFCGSIATKEGLRDCFYRYSLWREDLGEFLFDGSAGDLPKALETILACIQFLSIEETKFAGRTRQASIVQTPHLFASGHNQPLVSAVFLQGEASAGRTAS
jgi:hypothetical protein